MNKDKLKLVLLDQREFFLEKKSLIERELDLNPFLKTNQIVLISGIRRCGKSSLLYLIKNQLSLSENNILYFNFDDERLAKFSVEDFNKILELHQELFNIDLKDTVLFFDEVQNFSGWEKFLNRLYERKIKIFVTGSNANLLSSELGTALTGRNMVIHLHPFSFIEYLKSKNFNFNPSIINTKKKVEIVQHLTGFLKYGGFPLVVEEENLELVKSYYQDILYRDIISRYNLSQLEEIKLLGSFLSTNIGKIFSYSKLKELVGIKSLSTLKNYLGYFEHSYLFYYLKKFDYSIKKQILNPRKIYVSDLSFNSEIGFKFSEDYGRILENLVFIELKRQGHELYYHQQKNECDFVIKESLDITKAIQVTKSLDNIQTKKREFDGLLDAMSSYKLKTGLILTEDEEFTEKINDKDGNSYTVKVLPVWKWLLQDTKTN